MAYDKKTKIITKPVSISDIAKAIKSSSLDLGTLCESPKINKFAKYKPIRYDTYKALTEAQRKGMPTDISQNIFYGIKITGPTSGTLDNDLVEIHNTKFEYLQPRGGSEEPYRMLDFDGYKHDAEPNPSASFNLSHRDDKELVAFFNDGDHQYGSLNNISVAYYSNNIYGVDFTDMFRSPSETLEGTLQKSYPCVLVTDASGQSYFTALDYPNDDGTSSPRPLYYNGAYQGSTNWMLRFGKPRLPSLDELGGKNPWTSPQEGMKATIFLMESAVVSGPYLDRGRTMDFGSCWIPVGDNILAEGKLIVLPSDKLGAPLRLVEYGAARVYFEPTGITATSIMITVNYAKVGKTDEEVTLKCTARMDGLTSTKEIRISPSSLVNPIITFAPSEFGMPMLMPNTDYTINISMETIDSAGSTLKAGKYTFRIQ